MTDTHSDSPTETASGRRGTPRPPSDAGATTTNLEARSFEAADPVRAADEAAGLARDLSHTAAQATRTIGERSRDATREAATSWRGAMEPFLGWHLEMNRWFDDLWGQATGAGTFPGLRPARPLAAFSMAPLFGLPATDVKETEGAYRLCVELPGLSGEDVDLQMRGDSLLLSGHKEQSKEDAGAAYRISERRFGRFERRFPIPADVVREEIEAKFRDGVLSITLPKKAESNTLSDRIDIKQ